MSDLKINTKCLVGGYKPGNGEPRHAVAHRFIDHSLDTAVGDIVDIAVLIA